MCEVYHSDGMKKVLYTGIFPSTANKPITPSPRISFSGDIKCEGVGKTGDSVLYDLDCLLEEIKNSHTQVVVHISSITSSELNAIHEFAAALVPRPDIVYSPTGMYLCDELVKVASLEDLPPGDWKILSLCTEDFKTGEIDVISFMSSIAYVFLNSVGIFPDGLLANKDDHEKYYSRFATGDVYSSYITLYWSYRTETRAAQVYDISTLAPYMDYNKEWCYNNMINYTLFSEALKRIASYAYSVSASIKEEYDFNILPTTTNNGSDAPRNYSYLGEYVKGLSTML